MMLPVRMQSPTFILETKDGAHVKTRTKSTVDILASEGLRLYNVIDELTEAERAALLSRAAWESDNAVSEWSAEDWPAVAAWRNHSALNIPIRKQDRGTLQADLRCGIKGQQSAYTTFDSVSIVLVAMGDDHRTRAAIVRAQAVSAELEAQLVVVSVGGDEIDMFLPAGERRVSVPNAGFGSACNAGLSICDRKWVLFTQSDVTFDAQSVRAAITLSKCAAENGKSAVVGPSGGVVEHFLTASVREVGRNIGEINPSPQLVEWIAGYWMLCDAEAARDCSGFDVGYFLYYEDVDFSLRLAKSGHRPVVASGLNVQHARNHVTTMELPMPVRECIRNESAVRFMLTWCP